MTLTRSTLYSFNKISYFEQKRLIGKKFFDYWDIHNQIGMIYYMWLFVVSPNVQWKDLYPNFHEYFQEHYAEIIGQDFYNNVVLNLVPLSLLVFLRRLCLIEKEVLTEKEREEKITKAFTNNVSDEEKQIVKTESVRSFIKSKVEEYVKRFDS